MTILKSLGQMAGIERSVQGLVTPSQPADAQSLISTSFAMASAALSARAAVRGANLRSALRTMDALQARHVALIQATHSLLSGLEEEIANSESSAMREVLRARQERLNRAFHLADDALSGLVARIGYYQTQLSLYVSAGALVTGVVALIATFCSR
jgi:hypothetical protein